MRNLSYLFTSLKKNLLRQGLSCPSCGATGGSDVDRKYIVTSLRRCSECKLLYRTPTTSEAENELIYQRTYKEGFTTSMPTDEQLKGLIASGFRNGEKDYSSHLQILKAFGVRPGARIVDYGCSWGYGSWQLSQAGYVVDSFEISKPRADYAASKLGVHIIDDVTIKPNSYDVFFSAHVIEHVPNVMKLIQYGRQVLRPGGLFVAFTPNGNLELRQRNPRGFHLMWGFVHPQLIDWEFLEHLHSVKALISDTSPYSIPQLEGFAWETKAAIKLNGDELMFAIKKLD